MSDYQPISCANYDHFEIAILHGKSLRVTWHDEQALVHVEILRPRDLQTRNGAQVNPNLPTGRGEALDKLLRDAKAWLAAEL